MQGAFIMSTDFMALGRAAFAEGMSEEQVKTQHPRFRSGWREAKKLHEASTSPISALRPEKVDRPCKEWELQWSDLTAISTYHPWNYLERKPQLRVLAQSARTIIWNKRSEIVHFGDAVQMYRVMWEGLLQQGYDEGILDKNDLKRFDFTPKG